jgi:uncharacterized protein
MRWQIGRRSSNVEDRRGMGLPAGGFKIGGCGLLLVLLIAVLTGQNPLQLISYLLEQQPAQQTSRPVPQPSAPGSQVKDEQADFASAILASTEDAWGNIFSEMNRQYNPPTLVIFDNMVDSACGMNSSAVGPFYCPLDSKLYVDLSFFRELNDRFGATGDFARAYVIAHEVGHHVQNLLGISEKVQSLQQDSASKSEANALSVRLELQADCLAGVWANHADDQRQMLESGDVQEGLNAAAAVGDDRLQQSAGRAVSPESWTHGSSKMRMDWFSRGYKGGEIGSCDTFQARNL